MDYINKATALNILNENVEKNTYENIVAVVLVIRCVLSYSNYVIEAV